MIVGVTDRTTEEDVDDGRTSWSTSNFAAFDDDEDGWSVEPVSDNVPDDEAVWSVTAEDDDSEDELDDLDDLDVRASCCLCAEPHPTAASYDSGCR